MAGSMRTTGTAELVEMLRKLGDDAPDIAAQALYEGAKVVADAYAAGAKSILARERRHSEPGGRYPTPEEKAAVRHIGVAGFRKDGDSVSTVVGVAEGYAAVKGKKKAIRLLARSINSGTSFMKKQPVFRKASSRSRSAAQGAMVAKADELINQIVK